MTLCEIYNLQEINSDSELTVSQRIQDYFTSRGYRYLGEGRDQLAFMSPRSTVVKILGIGDQGREQVVIKYVDYFVRNQNNPYYPKIYNTGKFTVDDETYFIYEMEYLLYAAEEEYTLEYLEDLMDAAARGPRAIAAFQRNRRLPSELSIDQVKGLLTATEQLIHEFRGYQATLDLSYIENLRCRDDGHLVIIDPFSL